MTEQDRAILSTCAYTSVQCQTGQIPLHPFTVKNTMRLCIMTMLIEEPKVWEDEDL